MIKAGCRPVGGSKPFTEVLDANHQQAVVMGIQHDSTGIRGDYRNECYRNIIGNIIGNYGGIMGIVITYVVVLFISC